MRPYMTQGRVMRVMRSHGVFLKEEVPSPEVREVEYSVTTLGRGQLAYINPRDDDKSSAQS